MSDGSTDERDEGGRFAESVTRCPVVNLASRLVAVAPAGAIAMDDAFRSMLDDRGREIAPDRATPQDLKGIGATNVWLLKPERVGVSP